MRVVIADRAAERGVAGLKRAEHGADGDGRRDIELHLVVHTREGAEVVGQHDADHGSVWTSTESTFGRLLAMACQVSPPSGEQ